MELEAVSVRNLFQRLIVGETEGRSQQLYRANECPFQNGGESMSFSIKIASEDGAVENVGEIEDKMNGVRSQRILVKCFTNFVMYPCRLIC